jgi:hypothetical protein
VVPCCDYVIFLGELTPPAGARAALVDESLLPAFVAGGHFHRKLDPVEEKEMVSSELHTHIQYIGYIYILLYIHFLK